MGELCSPLPGINRGRACHSFIYSPRHLSMRSFQPQTLIRSTACQVAGIFWVWCGAKLGLLLLTHFRPTETLPPSRSCSSMSRRERDSAAPDSAQALANHFPPPSAPAEKSILPATSRNGQTDVTQISPISPQTHTITHMHAAGCPPRH